MEKEIKDLLESERRLREKLNAGRISAVEGWCWSSIRTKLGRIHGLAVDRETGEVYKCDPDTVPIFKMNGNPPDWAKHMEDAKEPYYKRLEN